MRPARSIAVLPLALGIGAPATAYASTVVASPTDAVRPTDEILPRDPDAAPEQVEAPAEARGTDSASRVHVGRRELELRPRFRPADVVESVPGLFAVQHAGGGKASQYFLRGFDADHGTDVALFVDGVPVNLPSHAHGQGFADLHFVIPELVVAIDAVKGPYYADVGDFATAGAVKLHLADTLVESVAQGTVGSFGVRRGLVIASPNVSEDLRLVVAGEAVAQDGPFQRSEDLGRTNLYAKLTGEPSTGAQLAVTVMSYASSWRASGALPARAVCGEAEGLEASAPSSACVPRFGFLDPSEGGAASRTSLHASYTHTALETRVRASAYAVRLASRLHSNFTFFAYDPIGADAIEQADARTVAGASVEVFRRARCFDTPLALHAGLDMRSDDIDAGLWRSDSSRNRRSAVNHGEVAELALGAFFELEARISTGFRVIAGMRGQRLDVNVADRLHATGAAAIAGARAASLALPKLRVVFTPKHNLDFFIAGGRGFHSNDARGAVGRIDPARLLTPAWGAEVGVRARPSRDLEFHAAAYAMDLTSELVWAGDVGSTEAAGRSRRLGLEVGARYAVSNAFFADAEATLSDARFLDTPAPADHIPLAPRMTLSAGFGARPTFGPWSPLVALRLRHLGPRPAVEDRSLVTRGFTQLDANLATRYRSVEVGVDVQNVLDSDWREVEFATTSRLAAEAVPVTGVSMTPGWPRTLLARVAFYVE